MKFMFKCSKNNEFIYSENMFNSIEQKL